MTPEPAPGKRPEAWNGYVRKHGSPIVVESVYYRYPGDENDTLRDVNLRFEPAMLHMVMGRNGSGKTTLARCLNSLLVPHRGRVLSCGLDTSAPENRLEIRRRVAMVFQEPETQLLGSTVEEEVAFGPGNLGLPPGELRRRVDGALALAGIPELAARNPYRLSQGQKQLVAVAGALAMEPSFLISDESTSMLDYASRSRVLELFRSLTYGGMGVIHITNLTEEALLADRLVVLESGRPLMGGTPEEVLHDPSSVMSAGLEPLPVTLVAKEIRSLGRWVPRVLRVEDLLKWLSV